MQLDLDFRNPVVKTGEALAVASSGLSDRSPRIRADDVLPDEGEPKLRGPKTLCYQSRDDGSTARSWEASQSLHACPRWISVL